MKKAYILLVVITLLFLSAIASAQGPPLPLGEQAQQALAAGKSTFEQDANLDTSEKHLLAAIDYSRLVVAFLEAVAAHYDSGIEALDKLIGYSLLGSNQKLLDSKKQLLARKQEVVQLMETYTTVANEAKYYLALIACKRGDYNAALLGLADVLRQDSLPGWLRTKAEDKAKELTGIRFSWDSEAN